MRPSYAGLRALLSFVDNGSLQATADDLAISESAVSKRLTQLQRELGILLLERRHGRLTPTPEGLRLAQQLQPGFEQIASAVQDATSRQRARPLRIACLPTFFVEWLLPKLGKLRADLSDLNIEFVTKVVPSTVEFPSGHIDALIEVGRLPRSKNLVFSNFMEDRSGLVGSGQYLARHGAVSGIEDLSGLTCLAAGSRPNLVEDWARVAGRGPVPAMRVETFDHLFMCLKAARDGLGLTIASMCYVREEIESGRLVAPFGFVEWDIGFYVAWPNDSGRKRALSRFVRWLGQQAGHTGGG